ncbi:Pleiotropic drug resistance ABC transporter protein [Mycena venus]|uniref:Pleiotropic drug resistance ABC transporter protein n=1 Tax=Mycena venus TaxID=2733690 RepID=A0A8H6X9C8_9AGAR|nr:Pleiotropic drug resistance ABC transporter protein [Mycena venus]
MSSYRVAPSNVSLYSDTRAQTSLSAQSSNLFQNAADFEIVGGQFVLGDVHNHHKDSGPAIRSTNISLPLNIMDETFSESEIYCNQLLRRKRGFPLYVPGPQRNLPAEYRKSGVQIGDVGRITPEGIFDFFFNIYLPPEHPINANIPEDFVPLSPYNPIDVVHHVFDPGNHVSTSSVQKLDIGPRLDEFVFDCSAPQGAVLALPYGAHLEKLENLETVRDYAAMHAESWYKYINGPRGRGLANGALYLVTGREKAPSWGMASFHSVGDGFKLAFKSTLVDSAIGSFSQYRWSGSRAQTKSYHPSPRNNARLNQTTFIHGLSISISTGIWGRLFGTVELREIVESRLGSSNAHSMSQNPGSSSSFSWSLGFLGGGTAAGGKHHLEQKHVSLSDLSPISKIFHPGELINDYILQKAPQATVVMSHDDDWSSILGDDQSTGYKIQNVSELLQRIDEQFSVTQKDEGLGVVTNETITAPVTALLETLSLSAITPPIGYFGGGPQLYPQPSINQDDPSLQTKQHRLGAAYSSYSPASYFDPQYPATPYTQYAASQRQPYSSSSTSQYGSNYPGFTAAAGPREYTEYTPPAPDTGTCIRQCYNCGAMSTPLWRRDHVTQRTLCNACGLYQAQRNEPRPQALIGRDSEDDELMVGDGPQCSHCGTYKTSVWRRNKDGEQVCNACGVYSRINGRERPLTTKQSKVNPRKKHS